MSTMKTGERVVSPVAAGRIIGSYEDGAETCQLPRCVVCRPLRHARLSFALVDLGSWAHLAVEGEYGESEIQQIIRDIWSGCREDGWLAAHFKGQCSRCHRHVTGAFLIGKRCGAKREPSVAKIIVERCDGIIEPWNGEPEAGGRDAFAERED